MKVFLVDDSLLVRERLAVIITELEGIELVGQSSDAYQAIDDIRRLRPDVVILDIRLERGSGLEVLGAVKKEAQPPIVIILTAFPFPQYRQRCFEAGAEYFFDKSTEFDRVTVLLRQWQQQAVAGVNGAKPARLETKN